MTANVPLVFSTKVETADWIRPRLSPFEQSEASSLVPNGFEAYARILHPAQLPSDGRQLVRWRDVSRWSGVPLSDRVQWHDIALPRAIPSSEPPWYGQGPSEGSPYVLDIGALIHDLARHTTETQQCFFCVWVGYLGVARAIFTPLGAAPVTLPPRDPPRRVVAMPHREYGLVEAPLSFATSLDTVSDGWHKTANLWWPKDRAWCVASGIDLRWTYVGGSSELIARILADERLEALSATPSDSCSLTIGDWLSDVIDVATDELMANGVLKLELALGSVEMTWRDEKRRGRFVISSSTAGRGASSSSSSPVRARDRVFLHGQMRSQVERAILRLT